MREREVIPCQPTHCSGVVAGLDVVDDLLLVLADDLLGCSSPQPENISSRLFLKIFLNLYFLLSVL